MNIEKKYYTVDSVELVNLLMEHINASEIVSFDTETDSLNMRKGSIVGWSVSGAEGVGFYLPTHMERYNSAVRRMSNRRQRCS